LGLASFTAAKRTKEMGIRKVLGSSTGGIVVHFSSEFLKLVVIAFLLAAPVAYLLMNDWLSEFAYRINIGLDIFIIAAIITFIIAFLSVLFNALRTARANPVEVLRYE
jgi:putative ABC transport system permease protein